MLGTASFRTLAELRAQARDLGVRWLDLTPFAGDEDGDVLDLMRLAAPPTAPTVPLLPRPEGPRRRESRARGVPIGGELDYLDDGTIGAALRARRRL